MHGSFSQRPRASFDVFNSDHHLVVIKHINNTIVDELVMRNSDVFVNFIEENFSKQRRLGARQLPAAKGTGSSRMLLGVTNEDAHFRF